MNIRELIKKDFGVDLPIKGGTGNSIKNPIIIEKTEMNDYVGTEYAVLKYLGLGRRIEWRNLSQELLVNNTSVAS